MKNIALQEEVEQIKNSLGLYKAEWLKDALYDFFDEPSYFSELKTPRPCVLIGGRGTGKTTALKGLSYEGQNIVGRDFDILSWKYYGLYYRVNTNRVTAFRGPELSDNMWIKYFGHYINLSFCQMIFEFVAWFEKNTQMKVEIGSRELNKFRKTLKIEAELSLMELYEEIELLILEFEAEINTIADSKTAHLSILGAPVDALANALMSNEIFKNKQFHFLIDEFENFEDYQQQILNTLIKHAPSNYTFKVGVRELGWRKRATLNENEKLTSPADYALISLTQKFSGEKARRNFSDFAEKVIFGRINKILSKSGSVIKPNELLPSMPENEEAELLIDKEKHETLLAELKKSLPHNIYLDSLKISKIDLHFLSYISDENDGLLNDSEIEINIKKYLKDKSSLKNKFDNYFHSFLFSIRKGKAGLRKYYSGWDVYTTLADGNIRYLLELVHSAVSRHLEDGNLITVPVSPKIQTEAAEEIGRKNLSELEGLSVDGAKLTKLVLSLGRIFQVMASDNLGHAPEVNQFHLRLDDLPLEQEMIIKNILEQSVMHLALVRTPGNKLSSEEDIQDYDYRLHPIFSPLFVFSHRKKRKFTLEGLQFLGLIEFPRESIKKVLSQSRRDDNENLPDQLSLFGGFYAGR